jgi:adenosine deaminase
MIIERTSDEFIIRFPITANVEKIQDFIDYLRYKELTATYSVEQSEVDKFAQEVNENWWKNNKDRFLKEKK